MEQCSRLFRPGAARRLAARFGILALLLQCFVFATHTPALAGSPLSDPAAWCFSGDLPADFQGPDDTAPQAPHKFPPCPLCQSLHLTGAALPPDASFIVVQFATYAPPALQAEAPAPDSLGYRPANSRAPPSLV